MMRVNRRPRRAGVLVSTTLLAFVWAGCSGKKETELVAGITSQVQVPRDFRSLRIDVNDAFGLLFCRTYPVYDGKVRLPRTLGMVNGRDANQPITITVAGFTQDSQDGSVAAFNDCTLSTRVTDSSPNQLSQGGGARVLRRARQPYVPGKILYVPMPLRYACYDIDCAASTDIACKGGDCTCRGGKCVPPDVDPSILAEYSDDLVFGTSNTCFRPFTLTDPDGTKQPGCIDDGVPPQVVDAAKCIYALPDTQSAAGLGPYDAGAPLPIPSPLTHGNGLNVRVVYDNVVSEVLDSEGPCPNDGSGAKEGYCLPDPSKPQLFQIADGICHNPTHKLTLITSSGLCPSKTELQPICDDTVQSTPAPTLLDGGSSSDGGCNVATPLEPAPSALYVLMDKSSGMRDFFGHGAFSDVIGIPLKDPVFNKTQIAFKYMPAQQTDCTDGSNGNAYATPTAPNDIPFEPSFQAQADIAQHIAGVSADAGAAAFPPGTSPWYIEAALSGAYKALANLQKNSKTAFNRVAVMLLIDRDFNAGNTTDCGGGHLDAIQEAAAANQSSEITTYVVFFKNADDVNATTPLTSTVNAQRLASNGNLNKSSRQTFFPANGTADQIPVQQATALNSVVADLSSCVYELPPNIGSGATISFPDVSGSLVTAKFTANCDVDETDTSPRWYLNSSRIRLCPKACALLQGAIAADEFATEAANIQNNTSNGAAGIPVLATEPCSPAVPDPPFVEAGVPKADTGAPDASSDAGPVPVDAGGGG